MDLKLPKRRQAMPDVVDLSDERPSQDIDLQVRFEPAGYASRLGHAMLLVDGANKLAGKLHMDIPALATRLHERGVKDDLSNMAIAVYDPDDSHRFKKIGSNIGGTYQHQEQLSLRNSPDNEHLRFDPILHVVAGSPDMNEIILHEAGHLFNFSTDNVGNTLYTPRGIARMKKVGGALIGISAATTGIAASFFAEGRVDAAVASTSGALLNGFAGLAFATFPRELLWLASSEERSANRFARECADVQVITDNPHPAVAEVQVQQRDLYSEFPLSAFLSLDKAH